MSDRVETGPLRFGADWAGVFLRGDYAVPMSKCIDDVLDFAARQEGNGRLALRFVPLRSLANILADCDERRPGLRRLPDFALCAALPDRIAAVEQAAADAEAKAALRRAEADYTAESIQRAKANGLRDAIKILRGET